MAIDLPDRYAEIDDLELYWRALSTAEQGRATALLGWAAQLINEQPRFETFDPVICAQVSMDMVKRALIASINGDGVSSSTTAQAMDDMTASSTQKFVNPVGNLYLTAQEADRLAGRTSGGAFSVALKSNVRVPGQSWNSQPSAQTDATT